MRLVYFLTIVCCFAFHLVQGGNQHRSILLSDVSTLTLHKGQRTQARRVSSIPQLRCVGGSAKGQYEPDVVQCYNRGTDGVDIQWECTAEMPRKYKFGRLSVSCEGYAYPEDPYILAGSCGLEYNLELTGQDSGYSSNVRHSSESRFIPFLIKIALIVGIFFFVKSCLSGSTGRGGVTPMAAGPDHRPPGGGGGPGWFSNFFNGGAPGGGNARRRNPPPPPGFRTDFTDDASCHNTQQQQQQQTGTGGNTGFLTGAALGALGGYLFGNRNRGYNRAYPTGTANTGWFGGGGDTTTTYRHTPSPSSSPSSGSTHTSSGFGGTTRR